MDQLRSDRAAADQSTAAVPDDEIEAHRPGDVNKKAVHGLHCADAVRFQEGLNSRQYTPKTNITPQ
jgi:hypothetical protein